MSTDSLRFQAIFENSLDGILLTAPTGEVLRANPAACRLLERSEAEIRRLGRAGLLDPADPRLEPALAERSRLGRFIGNLTMLRPNGERFEAAVSSGMFTNEAGEPRTCVIFRDDSERTAAEAARRNAIENLRAVINAAPLSVQGITLDGRVMLWNPASERIFGWTAAEVLGQFSPTIPPEAMEQHEQLRLRVAAGEAIVGLELKRRRKDGALLDVELSTAPIRDSAGRVTGVLGLLEEIGHRKAAEALRIREQRADALRQLVVGLRHEINNCLAGLNGDLELLALSPHLSPEDRNDLGAALSAVDRLAATVRRLDRVDELKSVPYVGTIRMLDVSQDPATEPTPP